jgi:hypothetical protein
MSDVMEINAKAGQYFFTPESMKFFNSRVGGDAFVKGSRAFFITSERFSDPAEHISEPRKFTIRSMRLKTGEISTEGKFQEFPTMAQAKKRLMELIK